MKFTYKIEVLGAENLKSIEMTYYEVSFRIGPASPVLKFFISCSQMEARGLKQRKNSQQRNSNSTRRTKSEQLI